MTASAAVCLTFDVEERFHSHLSRADAPRQWRIDKLVTQLLDWLEAQGKTATFFVVGEWAERHPRLVRRMSAVGEVACHTHTHPRLSDIGRAAFLENIARGKAALESITGEPVRGFRAPSWAAAAADRWLWDFLVENGFTYDSSLFPARTTLYGAWDHPLSPVRLQPGLVELPPAALGAGCLRLPYGGGFYFRLYPLGLTRLCTRWARRRGAVPVLYFHPWEFDPDAPRQEASHFNRFVANCNLRRNWRRFQTLLEPLPTLTMAQRGAQVATAVSGDAAHQ